MKILIIDPPSGWRYGFPKEFPRNILSDGQLIKWLLANGYPQKLIDDGMFKYCRYWEKNI